MRSFTLCYEGTTRGPQGYWQRGVDWHRNGRVDHDALWMESMLGVYAIKIVEHRPFIFGSQHSATEFILYYAPTRKDEEVLINGYYVPENGCNSREEVLQSVQEFANRHMARATELYLLEKELER